MTVMGQKLLYNEKILLWTRFKKRLGIVNFRCESSQAFRKGGMERMIQS